MFMKKISGIVNTSETIDKLCLTCNKMAMDYLATSNFDQSFKLLKNAEKILMNESSKGLTNESRNKLLSLTFNNMGCFYKKKEKPNVALFYLKSSLEIEQNDPKTEKINLAGTHLNLCAIYSKLNKHSDSTRHAKFAIAIIEQLIQQKELQKQKKAQEEQLQQDQQQQVVIQSQLQTEDQKKVQFDESTIQQKPEEDKQLHPEIIQPKKKDQKQKDEERKAKLEENNLYLTEAIAYYNLGASYEHQQKLEQCIKAYQIAQQIAKIHLSEQHPLYLTITESLNKANEKKKSNETTHMLRDFMRKEKATGSIFKNGNVSVMFKRLQRQSQINNTIYQDKSGLDYTQNLDNTSNLHSPIIKQKLQNHKRGNSMQMQRPVKMLNRTQVNSINNSLADINSALNQDTILSGELINDSNLNSKQVLAISNFTTKNDQQLYDELKHRKINSINTQSDVFDGPSQLNNYYDQNTPQINTSLGYQHANIQIQLKKPNTAQHGLRSRSNKYAVSLMQNSHKNQKITPKNANSNKLISYEVKQDLANSQIRTKSNLQKMRQQQVKQLYQNQMRLPIELESIRYDQLSPKVINGFPQEKSLTRLNRRLQSLESQLHSQISQ